MSAIPLTKPSPLQSLAYLEAGQRIACKVDLTHASRRGGVPFVGTAFESGRAYAVRPIDITAQRTVKRPAISGPDHEHVLTGRDTAIAVTDDFGRDWLFVESAHFADGITIRAGNIAIHPQFDFAALLKHFEIPEVPDIWEITPEHVEYNLKMLDAIERIVNEANAD